MYVEILNGAGNPPLRIPATQVVVRLEDGTPISLAALYGPDRAVFVEHCQNEKRFNDALRTLGVSSQPVKCVEFRQPPVPAGAQLISGPRR